jgi:hypothetical protein
MSASKWLNSYLWQFQHILENLITNNYKYIFYAEFKHLFLIKTIFEFNWFRLNPFYTKKRLVGTHPGADHARCSCVIKTVYRIAWKATCSSPASYINVIFYCPVHSPTLIEALMCSATTFTLFPGQYYVLNRRNPHPKSWSRYPLNTRVIMLPRFYNV